MTGLTLQHIADGQQRKVSGLPAAPRIRSARWSPDGQHVAFIIARTNGLELWTVAVDDGVARRLGDFHLNACYGSAFGWLPDSKSLIARAVPSGRGSAPDQ